MGKSTISMVIFNSKLLVITRGYNPQVPGRIRDQRWSEPRRWSPRSSGPSWQLRWPSAAPICHTPGTWRLNVAGGWEKKTSGPKIFDVFKGWGIVEWWIFRDFSTFRYMFGRPVAFPGCLEMEDLSQKMLCLWGISLILGSLFSNKAFEASSKLVTKLNIAGTHQVARSLCWCFHVGVRGWEESG